MANQPRVYINSPVGTAQYAWINKADTKFNDQGVYKLDLVLGGKDAEGFKALIDLETKAALARYFETEEGSKIPAGKRAKWATYSPYKEDEDAEGNPTGYTVFKFKQNAKIKLKDGTIKEVKVGIRDSKGKSINVPIFSGTELRVAYMARDIIMKTDMKAGIQLAIGWVQVYKLAESSSQNQEAQSPFGAPEEGYEGQDEDNSPSSTAGSSTGGDY